MKQLFLVILLVCSFFGACAARVDTVEIKTLCLDRPMKVAVVTPDRAADGSRFPTVYVLHGYGGDYRNWLDKQPRIKALADLYGMIVVMPDGRDTWYIDAPAKPEIKMESFFVNDLVPYIDNHFPTIAAAGKRAITGLSMGGHGALFLAFRHPDIFGNAGSMSGGVDIRPFKDNWGLKNLIGPKDEYPDRWEALTVINLVKDLKPGQVNITFDCGTGDFFAEVNENLHKELLEAEIPHDYASRPGKHTWSYWNNSILYHLLFFNEAFNR